MLIEMNEQTFKHIKFGMITYYELNPIPSRNNARTPCKVSFNAGWSACKEYYSINSDKGDINNVD